MKRHTYTSKHTKHFNPKGGHSPLTNLFNIWTQIFSKTKRHFTSQNKMPTTVYVKIKNTWIQPYTVLFRSVVHGGPWWYRMLWLSAATGILNWLDVCPAPPFTSWEPDEEPWEKRQLTFKAPIYLHRMYWGPPRQLPGEPQPPGAVLARRIYWHPMHAGRAPCLRCTVPILPLSPDSKASV